MARTASNADTLSVQTFANRSKNSEIYDIYFREFEGKKSREHKLSSIAFLRIFKDIYFREKGQNLWKSGKFLLVKVCTPKEDGRLWLPAYLSKLPLNISINLEILQI